MAYHGYQSFKAGEVTPEEAHRIGLETARRMWAGSYEVLVTTHLNTDNVHNHFVVNSVSFRDGRKYENHQRDHYRLREISDAICRELAEMSIDSILDVDDGLTFYLNNVTIDTAEQRVRYEELLKQLVAVAPEGLEIYIDGPFLEASGADAKLMTIGHSGRDLVISVAQI